MLFMATSPLNRQAEKLRERCESPMEELVFCSTSPLNRWGKTTAVIATMMILFALFAGVSNRDADVFLQAQKPTQMDFVWCAGG